MPWEALAGTFDVYNGPILMPIDMTVDGRRSSFSVPGIINVNMTPMINPVTQEETEVHIVHPQGGFLWDDGDVCTTDSMQIDHGDFQYEYPGKWAAYAIADWSNQT